jgi:hypothetical protein
MPRFELDVDRICEVCSTQKKFKEQFTHPSDLEEVLFVSYVCSACAKDGVEFKTKGFVLDGDIKKHHNLKD